jgi:hypothetical protein
MITNNVTQIAYLNAERVGIKKVIFAGGFLQHNPYVSFSLLLFVFVFVVCFRFCCCLISDAVFFLGVEQIVVWNQLLEQRDKRSIVFAT